MSSDSKWLEYPFPFKVIDNFLPVDQFKELVSELDQSNNMEMCSFKTPLESKTIYKDLQGKSVSNELVSIMSSKKIKDLLSEQIGGCNILSMGETNGNSGYSPFHITNNNGYLGTHVDHSFIKGGSYRHIANAIFYASSKWDKSWGGHTILFSNNGLIQKVLIDPIPNRMILFIHTANSFHGVKRYYSNSGIKRRTFYHDYYVLDSDINFAMKNINSGRRVKLIHSRHGTTFIPFIPFGLNSIEISKTFNLGNLKYIRVYIIYLIQLLIVRHLQSLKNKIYNFI
ncbi:2OG-Fe(II) oxygenase [Prochlorococcus sp. MIT 1223]|uniref:2OG-Fe(II) oxygenase n=1 Tax=Prochlorococcus sp. MIT 1223 TaxID=3096217 RepID=UPI002A7643E3|nr:2OG-Fe(II) oxygenase [Prochlorococcus sp. MIT 1223]